MFGKEIQFWSESWIFVLFWGWVGQIPATWTFSCPYGGSNKSAKPPFLPSHFQGWGRTILCCPLPNKIANPRSITWIPVLGNWINDPESINCIPGSFCSSFDLFSQTDGFWWRKTAVNPYSLFQLTKVSWNGFVDRKPWLSGYTAQWELNIYHGSLDTARSCIDPGGHVINQSIPGTRPWMHFRADLQSHPRNSKRLVSKPRATRKNPPNTLIFSPQGEKFCTIRKTAQFQGISWKYTDPN